MEAKQKNNTHLVIDIINNDVVFVGTEFECEKWKQEQGFGYKVSMMTKEEMSIYC